MQTFLPYPSIWMTVNCLDRARLGKQRVEAKQIIDILEGRGKSNKNGKVAWSNHPAVQMWKGHVEALKMYYNYCIDEWVARGYNNNMEKFQVDTVGFKVPKWWGDEEFHASHRSNLLRKDPEHYGKFGWNETPDLPYQWPIECSKCDGAGWVWRNELYDYHAISGLPCNIGRCCTCDECDGKGYIFELR